METKKTVLITGASGGFGLLTSLAFAEAGYSVIASMRNLEKKNQLLEKAKEFGVADQIDCIQVDVTNDQEVTSAAKTVIKRYGKIDVLINNAGYAAGGFIEKVAMDEWYEQLETNVFGLIRVTKAFLPFMREAQSGTIINMSSISGRIAMPGLGPYSTSKFAIEGFSEALRLEMKPYGVHVVLIEPGSYKTDIWSKGMASFKVDPHSPYKDKVERMIKIVGHIARKAGNPEEVVQLILKAAESENPELRYPVGKGVKGNIRMKNLMPWKWIERAILKKL